MEAEHWGMDMQTAGIIRITTISEPRALSTCHDCLPKHKEALHTLHLPRIKQCDARRERLRRYIKNFYSHLAYYINLAYAFSVQNSHSPFVEPLIKNDKDKYFFQQVFTGEPDEGSLRFWPDGNWNEVLR